MAGTSLSAVSRSGVCKQGWMQTPGMGRLLMMQLFPSMPPVTPGDGTTGPPPPPRSIPKDTVCKQPHGLQSLLPPAHPYPTLPQPNQLNPSCNHSEFSLETCELSGSLLWVWMVPKRCVRERSCWARGDKRGQEGTRGDISLPPERWWQGPEQYPPWPP